MATTDTTTKNPKQTIDEMFNYNNSLVTNPGDQAAVLNEQSEAAYRKQQVGVAEAQNQYVQNQAQNQLSALDAIRRSNASAIANGANAGLQAANELSAILGLQDTVSAEATNLANTAIDNAAAYNEQLNANAATGLKEANSMNATLSSNNAELAKSAAAIYDSDASAKATVDAADIAAAAQKYAADKAAEAQVVAQGGKVETTTDPNTGATTNNLVGNNSGNVSVNNQQTEANRKATNDLLDNILNDWNDYDSNNWSSASGWYDPRDGKTHTGERNSSDSGSALNKSEAQEIVNFIKSKLNAAYSTGNVDEINKWTEEASKFTGSLTGVEHDACLLPGTMVAMANGFAKPIELVTEGDLVMTWCSHTGSLKTAKIILAEQNKPKKCLVTTLDFADKTSLGIVTEHGFFDTTLRKYVYIHDAEDAKQYIGHKFLRFVNGKYKRVKLKKAYDKVIFTDSYSPCAARELCIYANGFLSMPGATSAFVNVFKYNKNAVYKKGNKTKLIKKYGLFKAEDLKEFVSDEIFHAFQGEYLKVKIAKNELSLQDLQDLMKKYSKYLIKE